MEVLMSLRKPLIGTLSIILLFAAVIVVAVAFALVGESEREIGSGEILPAAPMKTIMATTVNPFDVSTYPTRLAEDVAKIEHQRALLVRISHADAVPIPFDVPVGLPHDVQRTPQFDFQRVPLPNSSGQTISRYQNDGWILVHLWNSSSPDRDNMPVQFVVYSARSKPVMVELPASSDEIHYANIVFPRTSENEETILSGIALGDDGNPIENAQVYLRAYGVAGITSYLKHGFTDKNGRFTFKDIAAQPYQVNLFKRGYTAAPGLPVIPVEQLGIRHTHVVHYYKMRNVEIEYVYQPDGSRDFTKGNLQPRTATLESIDGLILRDTDGGFCFATGETVRLLGTRWQPLEAKLFYLKDNCGELTFHLGESTTIYYSGTGRGAKGCGFYDAGAVPFDSVDKADEDLQRYSPASQPAKLNHVYVVRTEAGKYAKLIVRRMSEQSEPSSQVCPE